MGSDGPVAPPPSPVVTSGGRSLKRQTCLPGRRAKPIVRFQMFSLIDAFIGTKCRKRQASSLCRRPRFLRERSSWLGGAFDELDLTADAAGPPVPPLPLGHLSHANIFPLRFCYRLQIQTAPKVFQLCGISGGRLAIPTRSVASSTRMQTTCRTCAAACAKLARVISSSCL